MKKLFIILSMLFGYALAQEKITYTPMAAAGYKQKYVLADSGFHLPFRDTTVGRGSDRPGALVFSTSDSLMYVWNGLAWSRVGSGTAAVIPGDGGSVDSVIITTDRICVWFANVATCSDFTLYHAHGPVYNHDSTKLIYLNKNYDPVDSSELIFTAAVAGTGISITNGAPGTKVFSVDASVINSTSFATVALMQAYEGDITAVSVQDPLRGGLFHYSETGTADNGVTFEATGKGSGYWVREVTPSRGVNATWFGAKGDGVTNDAPAIASALLAAQGNIFFPAGNYLSDTTLYLTSGIRLTGEKGTKFVCSTTFRPNLTQPALFAIYGQSDIEFRDLVIDCGYSVQRAVNTDLTSSGIYFHNVTINKPSYIGVYAGAANMYFDHCTFDSAGERTGIRLYSAPTGGTSYTNGTYTSVPLTGGSGTGARATITVSGGSVTAVTFPADVLTTTTLRGRNYQVGDVISASSANIGGTGSGFSFTVTALGIVNSIYENATGVFGSGAINIGFKGCLFKNSWQHGIYILGGTDGYTLVDGCAAIDNGGFGLSIRSQGMRVVNNYVEGNGYGTFSGFGGIQLSNKVEGSVVTRVSSNEVICSNNTILNNIGTASDLSVGYCNDVTITGNTITNSTAAYAVQLFGIRTGIIANNTIHAGSFGGIRMFDTVWNVNIHNNILISPAGGNGIILTTAANTNAANVTIKDNQIKDFGNGINFQVGTVYSDIYIGPNDYQNITFSKVVSSGTSSGAFSNNLLNFGSGGNVGIGTVPFIPSQSLSFGNNVAHKIFIEDAATDGDGKNLTIAAGGTSTGTALSNRTGGNLLLQSGPGTGAGSNSIHLQVGTPDGNPQGVQSYVNALSIFRGGNASFGSDGTTLPVSLNNRSRTLVIDASPISTLATSSLVFKGGSDFSSGQAWEMGLAADAPYTNLFVNMGTTSLIGFEGRTNNVNTIGRIKIAKSGIATTTTDGLLLINETAATALVPVEMSTRLKLQGSSWTGAASVPVAFQSEVTPIASSPATGIWTLASVINGASATEVLRATDDGKIGMGIAPTVKLHVGSASGGANGGIKLQQIANNATAGSSYITMDWAVPTTGTIGQLSGTASNYTSAANIPANSMSLSATVGSLVLLASNAAGDIRFNAGGTAAINEKMRIIAAGVGIGVTVPTALLHLKAGTATAGTAPLKLTSGTHLTTPEDGAVEFNGTHFYGTVGSTRYQLDQQGSGTVNSGTANRLGYYASTGTALSELAAITASRALASDANGLPVASTTTATELGYVNGVTSAIQTQIDTKLATSTAASTYLPLAGGTISGNILPPTTNTLSIGSSSFRFASMYASEFRSASTLTLASGATSNSFTFAQGSTERARFAATTGNLLINTTTDAASGLVVMESTSKGLLIPRTTTANIASISSPATGLFMYDTDLNTFVSFDGTRWRPIQGAYRVTGSNTQVSHTGTTSETTIATLTIPANAIGTNGSFHMTGLWTGTNNANAKTFKIKFNGTTVATINVQASTVSGASYTIIYNRNSQSAQVSGNNGSGANTTFNSYTTGGVTTATFASSSAITVTITATLANSADTGTMEAFEIMAHY